MKEEVLKIREDLNDYKNSKKKLIRNKITLGYVGAIDLFTTGLTLVKGNNFINFSEHPYSTTFTLIVIGFMNYISISNYRYQKKKLVLCKNKIFEHDLTQNCKDNFRLDEDSIKILDEYQNKIDEEKRSDTKKLLRAYGIFYSVAGVFALFKFFDFASWVALYTTIDAVRDFGELKSTNDTKKLIKSFKKNGKVL